MRVLGDLADILLLFWLLFLKRAKNVQILEYIRNTIDTESSIESGDLFMSDREFSSVDFSKENIIDNLSMMPGGLLIYRANRDEEILYANKTLLEIFECENGEQFKELTGGSFRGVVHPDEVSSVERSIEFQVNASTSNGFDQVRYRITTRSGKTKYVEDFGRLVNDPKLGPIYYVFIMEALIKMDLLTGLPNRLYFMELAEDGCKKIEARGGKAVILSFDLVGMKNFNSKFGLSEGDRLLRVFGKELKKTFGSECVSRFGEDHFYAYAESIGLEALLNEVIVNLHTMNNGKTLSVRIGIAKYDPLVDIIQSCDRAKAASDTLSNSAESNFTWFNDAISKNLAMSDYIVKNIDRAISEGWIHVYYQPVIRTLSENICSYEALARWIDPERGMISPCDFIPILEENGLSYKLDMHVVAQVTSALQRRMRSGEAVVPVSVNISRSDFDFCDPVTVVSSACDVRGVRRDLIAIEITETALMSDREFLQLAVARFHKAGFEVWMDDFGSGYSSLNALKDFDFDEIKLDMSFLRNFNEKSKRIMTAAVRMAKSLGVHTLAEGVETQEHLDFLRSIGCERIQGYYYGKPLPYAEVIEHAKQKNLDFESREMASFYQKTGLLDLVSPRPLALFFFDGTSFEMRFRNEGFTQEMQTVQLTDEETVTQNMNDTSSLLSSKFRHLAEKAIANSGDEEMTVVIRDRYFRFKFRPIAHSNQGVMLLASADSSFYQAQEKVQGYDSVVRNVISTFEGLYLVDLDSDTRSVLASSLPSEHVGDVISDVHHFYRNYSAREIHPDDLDRWDAFTTRGKIMERFKQSSTGAFCDFFSIKQPNGEFQWTEVMLVALPESNYRKFLVCFKPTDVEHSLEPSKLLTRFSEYLHASTLPESGVNDLWWLSLLQNANIKIFWKDRERRFVGASKAFLDYYGFKSLEEIQGKTDEEIGWHLDDVPFCNDEKRVLEKGEKILNSPGKNVSRGVPHNILSTKFPAYRNGKIIGLVGYFVDVENDLQITGQESGALVDPLTGLMNTQGLIVVVSELDTNFRTNGENYCYAILDVPGYQTIRADYGDKIAHSLVSKVSKILQESFASTVPMARVHGCRFAIVERNTIPDELIKKLEICAEKIHQIKEIDGRLCNLKAYYGLSFGQEVESVHQIAELANQRLKAFMQGNKNGKTLSNKILPDPYGDIPLPYVILKPVIDNQGKAVDIKYLFANQKYCEMTGISSAELCASTYLSLFPITDRGWIDCVYRASRGEYVHSALYDGALHQWMHFSVAPAVIPGACALIAWSFDEKPQ